MDYLKHAQNIINITKFLRDEHEGEPLNKDFQCQVTLNYEQIDLMIWALSIAGITGPPIQVAAMTPRMIDLVDQIEKEINPLSGLDFEKE